LHLLITPYATLQSPFVNCTATLKALPGRAKTSAIVPPFSRSVVPVRFVPLSRLRSFGHPFRSATLLLPLCTTPLSLFRHYLATLARSYTNPLHSRSLPLLHFPLLRTLRSQRLHAFGILFFDRRTARARDAPRAEPLAHTASPSGLRLDIRHPPHTQALGGR
jgi:hypothetical protein